MPDDLVDASPRGQLVSPTACDTEPLVNRIGVAQGLFDVPDTIDNHAEEVTQLFVGHEVN